MKFWYKKNTNFFACKEDRIASVHSKKCWDIHMEIIPHSHVHLSLNPLNVDGINGWPLKDSI